MENKILLEINRQRKLMSLNEISSKPNNLLSEGPIGQAVKSALKKDVNVVIKVAGRDATVAIETALKNQIDSIVAAQFKKGLTKWTPELSTDAVRKSINELTPAMKKAGLDDAQIGILKQNALKAMKEEADKVAQQELKKVSQQAGKVAGKAGQVSTKGGIKAPIRAARKKANQISKNPQIVKQADDVANKMGGKPADGKSGWAKLKEYSRRYPKTTTALKYAGYTGLAVLVLYWLAWYGEDEELPQEAEQLLDNAGGSGGSDASGGAGDSSSVLPNEEGVYTTPGDPYQYKIINGVWHTKGGRGNKIIADWTSLANNDTAIGILNQRFPDAMKQTPATTEPPKTPAPETGKEEEEVGDLNDF